MRGMQIKAHLRLVRAGLVEMPVSPALPVPATSSMNVATACSFFMVAPFRVMIGVERAFLPVSATFREPKRGVLKAL